ncbi:MAG: NUDIX domain-containing protein [Candidatus Doudnabacteria bacterium]|nr:NUDIX domain-containing protein [Candidatus Doudnabacteria bacterium]
MINGARFLAGKRSEDEIAFPGKYVVPGGKVDNGKSIEETLREEIREEAGVEVQNIFYVGDFQFIRPDHNPVMGLEFGCEYISGEVQPGEDMDTMEWLTIEEAEKLDFIPGVIDYVKKAFELYNNQRK